MKFSLKKNNKTVIHIAIEKGNPEMVQILFSNNKLDINIKSI